MFDNQSVIWCCCENFREFDSHQGKVQNWPKRSFGRKLL